MEGVKALYFDVGGTVFDWKNTAKAHIEALARKTDQTVDSDHFAQTWRSEMFKLHTQVRHGNLPWMNSDDMHLLALENMVTEFPLLGDIDRQSLVTSTWHRLNAFAGAPEAINRLRTRYTVVVLTVLNWKSIVSSSKAAGVQWDGILSCEFLGVYKPSLEAYRKAVRLLALKPSEAMMVAAHEGDLAAARSAGLHTALVSVPEADHMSEGFEAPEVANFDIEAPDFDGLCRELGV
ncbi:MAG: haloacid dehalogenase type II [Desulfosarcinaceae bacterium]|nr:haloacid dehalogenase type II [Desulfosarcinaceae bacterium]